MHRQVAQRELTHAHTKTQTYLNAAKHTHTQRTEPRSFHPERAGIRQLREGKCEIIIELAFTGGGPDLIHTGKMPGFSM